MSLISYFVCVSQNQIVSKMQVFPNKHGNINVCWDFTEIPVLSWCDKGEKVSAKFVLLISKCLFKFFICTSILKFERAFEKGNLAGA